jgi:N-acetylmuramoyl-L-alanine amidase
MDPILRRRDFVIASLALAVTGCRTRNSVSDNERTPPPTARRPVAGIGPGMWYHTTERDSITSISRRSGASVAQIIDVNQLAMSELSPGTRLWLPGVTSIKPDVPAAPTPEPHPKEPVVKGGGYLLVPRSSWTSARIKGNNNPMNGVTRITLHHTGEHVGLEGLPDIDVVRRIELYHRNEKRWAAIGYHYLVGKDGRVYEGRPVAYQGAHVSGANEHNLGISVMGDFHRNLPNSRQLAAVQAFLNDSRARFKVAKSRIYGHRDLNASICPGNALYGWLKKYKKT